MSRPNHTKDPMQKNHQRHRCLRNICRTYSQWTFPHQICSLMSGMVMKVPMFRCSRWVNLTMFFARGRTGDAQTVMGFFAEMFKYASVETKLCLLDLFNASFKTGQLELSWRHSEFVMLPKSGNLSETNNWRPIAILKIAYKMLSSLLHLRLRRQLDYQQSVDQVGFRPKTGVDHAFVVLEAIIGKTLEWQCGIWFASLDLRKAFDKVEHGALFAAFNCTRYPGWLFGFIDGNVPTSNWRSAWLRKFFHPTWGATRRCPEPASFQCRVGTRNAEMETEIDK